MERRDQIVRQSLRICKRLYDFFVSFLTKHAFKSVTLGRPLPRGLAEIAVDHDHESPPGPRVHTVTPIQDLDSDIRCNNDIQRGENETQGNEVKLGLGVSEAKAPKKMVSISDEVEKIRISKRRIVRKNSSQSFNSFEGEGDSVKPLKSILKLNSDLSRNSS